MKSLLRFTFFVLSILLTACSLAEDITPPPGIELTQTAAAPAPVFPSVPPNPANGAALYQQHCIKCHGPTGQGDGELAGQVNGQLPNFADPAALRDRTPSDLFRTITEGRLQQTMPPFANALSPAERWDVVAHLYTFAQTPDLPATGETIFAARCVECHTSSDFSPLNFFATHTTAQLAAALTAAHTFTEPLTTADEQAVVAYVRSLAYALPPLAEAEATPIPTTTTTAPVAGTVIVSGSVTNGTTNAEVPSALSVQLYTFDQFNLVNTYTTTVQAGRFEFANLSLQPSQALIAATTHAEVQYTSDVVRLGDGQTHVDLPITIFETTIDPGVLRAERLHLVFSPAGAGRWQVGELLIFSNTSDRVLTAAAMGQSVIEVPLPPGAANLQFQEGAVGQQYELTSDGFAYVAPVRPGPNAVELLFSFELPLETAQTFTQQLRYPIDAVNVLMPPNGLQLTSAQLTGPVAQEVQGTQFLAYTGANLPMGSELTLMLAPANTWPNWLVPTLAVVGAGVFITVWIWRWQWRRQRHVSTSAPEPAQRRAALITALAQLDDDFEQGRLAEAEHRRRRAKLKAEVLDLTRQIQNQ